LLLLLAASWFSSLAPVGEVASARSSVLITDQHVSLGVDAYFSHCHEVVAAGGAVLGRLLVADGLAVDLLGWRADSHELCAVQVF